MPSYKGAEIMSDQPHTYNGLYIYKNNYYYYGYVRTLVHRYVLYYPWVHSNYINEVLHTQSGCPYLIML